MIDIESRISKNVRALLAVLRGSPSGDAFTAYEYARETLWRDYGMSVDVTLRTLKRAEALGLVVVDRSRHRRNAQCWTIRRTDDRP